MPQTSIGRPAIAIPGQSVHIGPEDVHSFAAEANATRQIAAGSFVLRGTDPDLQALAITDGATLDATTLAGLVLANTQRAANTTSGDQVNIADGDMLRVMRKGHAYVQVTAAVVAGNPVYVGTATAQLGDVDDATGTGLTVVPGARFMSSAAANGYAIVELDL